MTRGCTTGSNQTESFWVEFDLGAVYDLDEAQLFGDTVGTWHARRWSLQAKQTLNENYRTLIADESGFANRWSGARLTDSARYVRLTVSGTRDSNSVEAREFILSGDRSALQPAEVEESTTKTTEPVEAMRSTPNTDAVTNISGEQPRNDSGNSNRGATNGAGVTSTPTTSQGERLRATENLNVRSAPGGALIQMVSVGSRGMKLGTAAVQQGGLNWIRVRFDNGVVGYVAESYTQSESITADRAITPGATETRVRATDNLNVRATAGGTLRGVQIQGAQGTFDATQSRVSQGGYQWVQVDFDQSPDGWVAEVFLAEITSRPTTDLASMTRDEIIALIQQLLILIMAQQAQ